MKAMILAAGRGERMKPLTDEVPKPLLKVGQHMLIEHILLKLHDAGISEVVINIKYFAEKIASALGDGSNYGVKIFYSDEDEKLLGTGGGIKKALPFLGEQPFIVVSADIWTQFSFQALMNRSCEAAHLVMVENPDFNRRGDFGLAEGYINLQDPKKTFGNISILNPKIFDNWELGYFSLAEVLSEPIANGQVTGEFYAGDWRNVGTPALLHTLRQDYSQSFN